MKTNSFEKRHHVSYDQIVAACNTESTMVRAANSVNVPYKTFIRIAKKLKCFTPNQGGKSTTKKSTTKIPLSDILLGLYPSYDPKKIRRRLIQEGLKEAKCECCQLREWNNQPIPLELHHLDGNNSNHLYGNLEILCPNCHSQTANHSKNK